MGKNKFKRTLALGMVMAFLITGNVWANTDGETQTGGGTPTEDTTPSPKTSVSIGTDIVPIGDKLVSIGDTITANGDNIVSIGSNITSSDTIEGLETFRKQIKQYLDSYNFDTVTDMEKLTILQNLKADLTDGNDVLTLGPTATDDTNNTLPITKPELGNSSNLVAIGSDIKISGENSVAIGSNVTVSGSNSVAIGSGSVVTENNVVSFGNDTLKRKLTNVANGSIAQGSTDAVNGSQLWAEETRRTNMDNYLQAQIDAEESRRINADADLKNKIETEANRRERADANLQSQITKNANDIDVLEQKTGGIARNDAGEIKTTTIEGIHSFKSDGSASLANGNFTVDANGNTQTNGSASFGTGNYQTVISQSEGYSQILVNNGHDNQVLINENGIKVGKNSVDINYNSISINGRTMLNDSDVSIVDPDDSSKRIALSDVGQVDNLNEELKQNSNYSNNKTTVGAINAEADIRSMEVNRLDNQIDKLGTKLEKVGAGAAALAALHPLDYDPDDKLTFSAGVGNYAGENATALGAFYRPDEKVMFSFSGTLGTGEDMLNLGISFGLDGAKGVPKLSRKELIQKVSTMEAENKLLVAKVEAADAKTAKMEKEVAELKAMLTELLAKQKE